MVASAPALREAPDSSRVERLRATDGVDLTIESFGTPTAPSIVFAHGFGQTRHAWSAAAATLARAGWYCISADARGHGDSGWREDGEYDFGQFVDDLVTIAHQPSEAPILVGASMSGLLGLIAQAKHAPFRALVLVDITPRWEAAGVERIIAFMHAYPQGFVTFEEAADAIARYLPHRAERKSPQRLRQLLVPSSEGRLRWHWDPRLLDRIATDSERHQTDLLAAARKVRVPTLLISGERSDIVSAATIQEFLHCVPHAVHVRVADATHMIVGDRNDAFTAAVERFITPLRDSRGSTRSTS